MLALSAHLSFTSFIACVYDIDSAIVFSSGVSTSVPVHSLNISFDQYVEYVRFFVVSVLVVAYIRKRGCQNVERVQ